MPTDTEHPPGLTPGPPRRRSWLLISLFSLAVGAFVGDGSRRTPADATKPILIQGAASPGSTDPKRLRIATFNIHSGRGLDHKTDLSRIAAVFDESPDVVGLNEVRGTLYESWWPDQAAQLGQRLAMESAFVPTERRWWHDHFGNGLLTRFPLRQIHRIPLVGTRGKAFRCATLAQFEFQQKPVQLLAVHVDSQSDREHQLRAVISLFLGLKPPAILIGDLNSGLDDPQLQDLVAQPDVTDSLHDVQQRHIDWILARGFHCHSGRLIENDASDHPAAIAELELIE